MLYVGARLPSRSETFVYRELLALRGLGWTVHAASVHPPERDLGDPTLERLAGETLPIYGQGLRRLLTAAARECLSRPLRSTRTLALAAGDAFRAEPRPLPGRLKILGQAVAGLALARAARRLGVGHVHAHMAHVPTTIAMYAATQLGTPFSFTGHANDIFRERTLLREKLGRASFAACISEWHRDLYRALLGKDQAAAERLPVVRCAVDCGRFAPAAPDAREPGLIVSVGRLVPKKGFDVLIRALAKIAHEPWRCVIAGDGPERPRLESLRDELGLRDRVELLGAVSNDRVRSLLSRASLFALACRIDEEGDRDGIPVVLMEAMSFGLPVIAGDLPAIRELVDGAGTGLLATPGDAASVADAVARVLRDRAMAERLGAGGRRRVEEEFGERTNVLRLSSAIEAASRATPAPARTDGIGPGL